MRPTVKKLLIKISLLILIGVPFICFPGFDWRHWMLVGALVIISFDVSE